MSLEEMYLESQKELRFLKKKIEIVRKFTSNRYHSEDGIDNEKMSADLYKVVLSNILYLLDKD